MSPDLYRDQIETLKQEWTDRLVTVRPDHATLMRFVGRVGRVVTVNWNGKAIVDFQDGAWYDISPEELQPLDPAEAAGRYDATRNSAQPHPSRQG
jgi:hypothetical protein